MTKTEKYHILWRRLMVVVIPFIFVGVVIGPWADAYNKTWWLDDVLHALSGVILVFMGLVIVHMVNARSVTNLSPRFAALFVFCFAAMVNTLWEVFEFAMDYYFGLTMQKWNLPSDMVFMGHEYQGVGLRDTMSDLILAGIGSLLAAVVVYAIYKEREWRPMPGKIRNVVLKVLDKFS